jgi:Dynamin family
MSDIGTEHSLDVVQQNAHAVADAFEVLGNALADRNEFSPLAGRARQRAAELRDNKFTVMVVGEFKRGKSTVLNAMLGARALPMKLTPCTAIVTFVRHGGAPEVLVAFNDDRSPNPDHLTLEEFNKKYQLELDDTQSQNDKVGEAARREITDRFGPVDYAVIRYPSEFLQHGVEIVDTPGLNEHDARTARVFQNLAAADAIIMVLDAITVCNQEEIKFIEQRLRPLGLHKHVFFLINRWNIVLSTLLDPNDPKEVESTLANQLKFINSRLVPFVSEAGPDKINTRIFKVNALDALRQRLAGADGPVLEATEIPAFERALREFLTVDRDAVRRDKDRHIAHGIAREVKVNVDLLIRQARMPIASFEAEREILEARIGQLDRIKINIVAIIRAHAAETGEALSNTLEAYLNEELFGRLKEHVDRFDLGEIDSVWTQYKLIYEKVKRQLDRALDRILAKKVEDDLKSEEAGLEKRIETHLQGQIAGLVSVQIDGWRDKYLNLEIKLRTTELQERLRREAGEYVKVVAEIRGEDTQTHKISDEEIARKINDWVRGSTTDFGTVVAGAGFDLAPIMAGVVADIALHVFGASLLIFPAVGVIASAVLAVVRTEYNKSSVRAKIVEGLAEKKREILLDQRVKLLESVEDGFKRLSDPISQSIESEIAVIKANMQDILNQRQKADFDAHTYEIALRGVESAVDHWVAETQRLVG